MSETRKLAEGIHDNHGLKLWHEWQDVAAQDPQIAGEWRYERDNAGAQYAGPGESLTRTVGNVALRVVLGGDGRYTPLAEMIEKHGAAAAGPKRVKMCVSPPRSDALFEALAAAEEAAGEVGQPLHSGGTGGPIEQGRIGGAKAMNTPTPTHAQAELLVLIEAKFAQQLDGIEDLSPWLNDVAALGNRYCAAGGSLDELQARFNDARTPLGGQFFFSQKGPF